MTDVDESKYPRIILRSGEYLNKKLSERSIQNDDIDKKNISMNQVGKRDLIRWYETLQEVLPAFSHEEARTLCACLNGVRCSASTLYGNIVCADELESNQWNIDRTDLLERIRVLSTIEAWAIIDAVERAWNAPTYSIDLNKRIMFVGLVK